MRSFSDTEGRQWNVKGTLGVFERIKQMTEVDMLDLPTTQQCLRQISDPFVLGKVLYATCQDQCESRNVTPEQFADGFNADTLHEATNALLEEVVFFCRKDVRPALTMVLEKARKADDRMVAQMESRMAELETEIDAAVEAMLTTTSSATSSPALSASTQEIGPSAA